MQVELYILRYRGLYSSSGLPIDETVLRAAGDAGHFQVVLIGYKQVVFDETVTVCIYSSETRLWSDPISTPVPREVVKYAGMPAVLVGNSLYWLRSSVLLELDLCRQSMAVTQAPSDMFNGQYYNELMVVRAEGGGLGLLSLSDYTAQLWKWNTDCDGATSWVMGRTFELDELLSLDSQNQISTVWLLGYAEENNVVLLKTFAGTYMVQLETLHCKLVGSNNSLVCYPFESVYAAETVLGGEPDGADQDMLL